VTSVDAIYKLMVASAGASFEKFREQYFMIDLFPENAERYSITAADFDPK